MDDLKSTAIPFAQTLPMRLKDLSKLLLRQTDRSMVSFHRGATSPEKKRNMFDGGNTKVQAHSLPPTSNLLELLYVKELTVMASSASYGSQAVSQERVSEVKAIVKMAMAHFPELKSLEVHRCQELFDSLEAVLAGLTESENLALPFDLHLVGDFQPELQPKRITIRRNIVISSSKLEQEQYEEVIEE